MIYFKVDEFYITFIIQKYSLTVEKLGRHKSQDKYLLLLLKKRKKRQTLINDKY